MSIARTYVPTILAVAVAALALGGCGASDEEQIRSAVRDLGHAFEKKDAERACELLGPNAEAQYVAILSGFSGVRGCADLVRRSDPDEENVASARRQVTNAKITVRGDLAMLAGSRDEGPIGLRKIDGDWRVDDLLTPSLDEPPRGEKALTRGSDEQQIRATATAAAEALRLKDFERLCRLMSPGAEAQIIVGGAFASMFSGSDEEGPSTLSCSGMLRDLTKLTGHDGDRGFLDLLPSRGEVGRARIAIRGTKATIDAPGNSVAMIRLDGRWLFDADVEKPSTAADLKRCWQAAGAKIATRAEHLRFADENEAKHIGVTTARVSVKGPNWRIFYTMDKGAEDPGLFDVLRDPRNADVVAYVRDAAEHPDVVTKARDCGA